MKKGDGCKRISSSHYYGVVIVDYLNFVYCMFSKIIGEKGSRVEKKRDGVNENFANQVNRGEGDDSGRYCILYLRKCTEEARHSMLR